MRLCRFGTIGSERPAILLDGARRDCSAHFDDWNPAFFASNGMRRLGELIERAGGDLPPIPDDYRWAACIARPGKIVCVGLNYRDHAEEAGMAIPTEPILFMKAPNTVVGPFDEIRIPRKSVKTDWEVELGVVIGRDARYLDSPDAAPYHIAGYCISHDVSEREFQLERGGQWVKGKSCDTFNPLGPCLVTPDEIGDVMRLPMTLSVNRQLMQNGNTRTMIFDVHYLVHYISQFMTLEAGDLISTGTPPGVGMGQQPQRFLREGDEVVLTISGLGEQRQRCRHDA